MLIFVFGEDTFRSKQKITEIIDKYNNSNSSGFNFHRLTDFDFSQFKKLAEVVPMFGEKGMILLENVFKQKVDEELETYLDGKKSEDDNLIIVFWEDGKISRPGKLYKRLTRKGGFWQDFQLLTSDKLLAWADGEIKKKGGQIEGVALKKLIANTANNLWLISGEINKLIGYKGNKKIIEEDVDLLGSVKWQNNIFETVDALGRRDRKTAIDLIHKHLEQGDSGIYLLTMMIYQFRNLIQIRDLIDRQLSVAQLTKQMGLHPFVLRKTLQQVKNFSADQLRSIYGEFIRLDEGMKTGQVDLKVGLDLLLMAI